MTFPSPTTQYLIRAWTRLNLADRTSANLSALFPPFFKTYRIIFLNCSAFVLPIRSAFKHDAWINISQPYRYGAWAQQFLWNFPECRRCCSVWSRIANNCLSKSLRLRHVSSKAGSRSSILTFHYPPACSWNMPNSMMTHGSLSEGLSVSILPTLLSPFAEHEHPAAIPTVLGDYRGIRRMSPHDFLDVWSTLCQYTFSQTQYAPDRPSFHPRPTAD